MFLVVCRHYYHFSALSRIATITLTIAISITMTTITITVAMAIAIALVSETITDGYDGCASSPVEPVECAAFTVYRPALHLRNLEHLRLHWQKCTNIGFRA